MLLYQPEIGKGPKITQAVERKNQTENYNEDEFYSEGGNLRCPG